MEIQREFNVIPPDPRTAENAPARKMKMGEAASCANRGSRPAAQMGEAASCANRDTAGQPNGGSGQLCKSEQRLGGQMGEAASCADRYKPEIGPRDPVAEG